MEDKELRKAFEEVTTNNVKAGIEFGNKTRKIVKDLQDKVLLLEGQLRQYDDKLDALQLQISKLQQIMFRGGT